MIKSLRKNRKHRENAVILPHWHLPNQPDAERSRSFCERLLPERGAGADRSTFGAQRSCKKDDPVLFQDVLISWMRHNEIRQKGSTQAKYQFLIENHLIPDLGQYPITSLSSTTINMYLSQKLAGGRIDKKGGLSPSYIRSITLVIHSALQYAVEEHLCEELRSRIYKPPIAKKEFSILDRNAQRLLEAYIKDHLSNTTIGILISLYTGLRIGEVCALRWEDIDLEAGVLHVRHTIARVPARDEAAKTRLIVDSPKTKASYRDIPIASALLTSLVQMRKAATSAYVVSDTEGFVSPRTFEYRFHRVLYACGVPKTNYHTLRHTFATRCMEAGCDVKSLSDILGHSNASITLETYVHSSMQMKRTQLEKLSAL